MCHSSTRPGTSYHVTQFYQAFPRVSTASNKRWGEKDWVQGYKSTAHTPSTLRQQLSMTPDYTNNSCHVQGEVPPISTVLRAVTRIVTGVYSGCRCGMGVAWVWLTIFLQNSHIVDFGWSQGQHNHHIHIIIIHMLEVQSGGPEGG